MVKTLLWILVALWAIGCVCGIGRYDALLLSPKGTVIFDTMTGEVITIQPADVFITEVPKDDGKREARRYP